MSSSIDTTACPLCFNSYWGGELENGTYSGECARCGFVQVTEEVMREVWSAPFVAIRNTHNGIVPGMHLLQGLTKHAPPGTLTISKEHLKRLERGEIRDKTVPEKIELALRWFSQKTTYVSESLIANPLDYPAALCAHIDEWNKLLHMISKELGLLDYDGNTVIISLKGWEWLQSQPKASGRNGFIAMSFDPSLTPINRAIQRAVEAAGYEPIRVDENEYTGGVMDKVISELRNSRFVVADFTRNRGGVYYEAGFAAGLGIPVIHLCNVRCMNNASDDRLHFDVQHLNFLTWEDSALDAFTERLRNRIVALFGRGPIM